MGKIDATAWTATTAHLRRNAQVNSHCGLTWSRAGGGVAARLQERGTCASRREGTIPSEKSNASVGLTKVISPHKLCLVSFFPTVTLLAFGLLHYRSCCSVVLMFTACGDDLANTVHFSSSLPAQLNLFRLKNVSLSSWTSEMASHQELQPPVKSRTF